MIDADAVPISSTNRHWRALLVMLLVAMLVRPALGASPFVDGFQTVLFWVIFFGTIETAGVGARIRVFARLTLSAWILLQIANMFGLADIRWLDIAITIVNLLLAAGVVMLTFNQLLRNKTAEFDSIVGAVFGFLLIALAFALVYAAVEVIEPGAFSIPADAVSFSMFLYYSLVTMTTLGYGDMLPVSDFVRILAGLQAMFGTLYFTVFIGALVGRL